MMIRSSAANLAVGYVLLGLVALVLFALPLGYAWHATVEDYRVEVLSEDAQRMTAVFDRGGVQGLTAFINERVSLRIAGERLLLFTDPAHRPLAGNLAAWPRGVPDQPGDYNAARLILDGRPTLVTLVRSRLPGGYDLLVGRDVDWLAPVTTRFWYGLAGAVAVLCVSGIVGGVLIRRALLFRIHGIRQTVSAIMQGDLSHRLSTHSRGDELDTLSQTINRMLDQIEQLVHGVANVSNAIAHDLRTPLAELRSRLEELSLTRPAPDQCFAEIDGAVADVDSVIRIFNALLRLAEIDTGMRRSEFLEIDLAEVAAEAVEFYQPAAELKDISLQLRAAGPARVHGDRVLITQAVGNLIDNALKYTRPGGNVGVRTEGAERVQSIVVSDDGPGIPAAELSKVTGRFYRCDASRGTPGVGLGLSLVEAVARLHGGALLLTDNHPGLAARMTFEAPPLARAASAALPPAARGLPTRPPA
ncbi:MAG TPA: HAMP domain-containing sensor histidine kinase [Steroidobacteraceae bacterium]|nr:HAMP domain-containing sensor histidine kinase [Steroidobacteraceae bacterium]